MIVERITFKAKYGHGDELVALLKELLPKMPQAGVSATRIYTDLTGEMFTVQMETETADVTAWAAVMQDTSIYADPEFQKMMARMTELTDGGSRQLLNVETLS